MSRFAFAFRFGLAIFLLLTIYGHLIIGAHVWVAVGMFTDLLDRTRPIPLGNCRRYGYDLSGNTSGRCPECGAAVKGNENAHP